MFESRDIEDVAAMKKNAKKLSTKVGMMFDDLGTMLVSTFARSRLSSFLGLNKGARRGEFSQTIGEETEIEKAKAEKAEKFDAVRGGGKLETLYKWSDGTLHSSRESIKDGIEENRPSFQADAMAQAGLFQGTSLLLNLPCSFETTTFAQRLFA